MGIEQHRITWLDASKAVAALLVVLGHAFRDGMRAENLACQLVFAFIYRFHMPLWFFISGYIYGFHREKYGKGQRFISSRFKKLMVPYLVYGLLMFGLFFSVSRMPGMASVLAGSDYARMSLGTYGVLSLAGENPYAYHIWFLEALFLFSCVSFFIDRAAGKRANSVFWAIIGMVVGIRIVVDNMPGVSFLWIMTASMRNLPWYLMGILAVPKLEKILASRNRGLLNGIIAVSVAFLILRVWVFPPFLNVMLWRIVIQTLEYGAVGGMILAVLLVAGRLKGSKLMKGLGKHSYTIYLLHQPMCGFLGVVLYDKLQLPIPLVLAVCITLSLFVPWMTVKFLRYTKLNRYSRVLLNIE